MTHFKKIIIAFFIALLLAVPLPRFVFAQNNELQVVEARKAQLEAELAVLEKEIAEKEALLNSQKTKSASLQRDIDIIKTKIGKAKLDIKSQNLIIEKLTGEINKRTSTIQNLSEKIIREKQSLAQLIRKTNELEKNNLVHLILASQTLSELYGDIDSFSSIKEAVKDSVDEIKNVKKETEGEKEELKKKQDEEVNAKKKIEQVQREMEKNEKEQKTLLSISKDKEKEYEALKAERERRAAEIRSALFALRDTSAIPFGQALEFANFASSKTGVRPALILAILTQESRLGENIGSCFLKDSSTGDGIGKNTGTAISRVMNPSRDVPPFLEITKKLGLDSFGTPVSCPWTVGWGGAMGPSQFIASTWKLFESKIANAVGVSTPNPWEPKDAIAATAIYMKDLGAAAQTFTAERDAACRYYSGRSCSDPAVKNLFYGNAVMEHARNIQENMIDPLLGV